MRGDCFISLFIWMLGLSGTSLHLSALDPMQVHFKENDWPRI